MITARNVRQIVEDDSNPQDAISPRHDSFLDTIGTFPVDDDDDDDDDDDLGKKGERAHRRRLTDLWRVENVALPLSYFVVGFALTFISTPITYYAVDSLDASSALVNTLSCVQTLPWGFKLIYGILSDCTPIMHMRRKPYFIIGWVAYVLCNLILAFIGTPNISSLITLVFLQTAAYMLSDVMSDALIVERSKLEASLSVGTMQATGYILRYFGNIIGSTFGTVLYNKEEWGWGLDINQVFFLNAAVPVIFVFPFMWQLHDQAVGEEIRTLQVQFEDIWDSVQKKSIWLPMIFIYLYNALMIPNAAWNNFLIDGLSFTDWMIGVVNIAGAVFAWLGIIFYRYYLFHDSWRVVYIWTTVILLFFSCMQLMLIFQINTRWHISNLVFSLGDNSASDFVMAVQFLPIVKMYLALCPEGAEGTTYAMLTTYTNVASAVAYNIGTLLSYVWDVSNEAITEGDWTGMWKLTLLTSCLNPIALVFIWCIPESPEHQKKLQECEERSWWGGFLFLTVLITSLAWSIAQTIVVSYI